MSEELNPTTTTEELTTEEATAEEPTATMADPVADTTVAENTEETTAAEAATTDEAATGAAPVAETTASAAAAPLASPSQGPAANEGPAPAPSTAPAPTLVSGPQEFSGEYQGGRSRRIGNDVRLDDIDYKNIGLLTRFIDQRGRILSRRKTRVNASVQRQIVKSIKRARHLALLPFTSDQTRIVRKRR